MSTLLHPEVTTEKDFLPLNGTDYVEFYVGNARQASYVVQQGKVRFVLTTPLRPDGEIAHHVHRHGDGVRDVALWVDDARQAWKETTKRGARSVHEPYELKDKYGTVKLAAIATYGDTI